MNILYNLLILIIKLNLHVLKYFNKKIYEFTEERKNVFDKLKSHISEDKKYIWIHVASLGEYEQGLPIFKEIKSLYKDHKIILSFFSASGYKVRKNNPISDLTVYLPLDSTNNAKRFIDLINPQIAIFVKYEFWPNFLKYLSKKKTPTYLIAGVFRENHWFFKPYGFWMKNNLKTFDHFFVQNQNSKNILNKHNFNNCSVMGDSRFERVVEIPKQDNQVKYISEFKSYKKCIVAGSTWEEDEKIIINFINNYNKEDVCYIIVPHQIDLKKISKTKSLINKKTILMSEINKINALECLVIIVDSIGILTSLYNYADIAYVGGGMGNSGLHNTLEPAVFKIPVIVGKNFEKFHEVSELINLKGFISIKNYHTFKTELIDLINNKKTRNKMGQINYKYILNKIGASEKVITYLKQKK